MNVLYTGIYNKYAAGGDLYDTLYINAKYHGMYLMQAPQTAPLPYCVYGLVAREQEYDFTDEHEVLRVFFDIYSETGQEHAGVLLGYLKSLYDNADLIVVGWRQLWMLRKSTGSINDISRDPPGYGYHAEYEVLLEQTR